jgi:serine protease
MMNAIKNGLFVTVLILSSSVYGMKTTRLIVKFKNGGVIKSNFASAAIKSTKSYGEGRVVIHAHSRKEMVEMMESYQNDDSVVFVEEDKIMKHFYEPGDGGSIKDQQYSSQWHYFESNGGVNLPAAWDLTRGSSSTVVAVIDTGITGHSDLNSKVLPGADLISDPYFANDGGGRDSDPSDPGDWVQFGDLCYQGFATNSSWHGTHIAGTIAASTGNGIGVSGVNWNAKILPVRVLGKCGGYESDIADGIRWAAGQSVAGLSANPNPAKVINLSLGGVGGCSFTMQSAVDEANKRGAIVVVAAGNDNADLNFQAYSPANCRGVLVVGASNRDGSRSYYSNHGSKVDLVAPGGDHLGAVLSTHNGGSTAPGFESYSSMSGTSMSAPHVAGIASLMLAVRPGLYPAQLREILRNTAQSFPWGSSCNSSICGHGIVDAYTAVVEAATTTPDPNYVGNDHPPVSTISGQAPLYRASSDDDGVGCGTIVYDDGNSNGPKGGIPVLFFTLCLMLVKLTGKKLKFKN